MIVDMAGDNITGDKEPTELVLAAVNQGKNLKGTRHKSFIGFKC